MEITVLTKHREEPELFECDESERLLYAGLRAGIALPHECATGTCGSCRAQLVSGEVELLWPDSPARRFLRRGSDEILLCQSRPKSDCRLAIRGRTDGRYEDAPPLHTGACVLRSGMLTHDVRIIEVVLDHPMRFKAGQFVLLGLDDIDGYRAYSMINSPTNDRRLELILKRKPRGSFSERLFDQDIHGLRFKVFGPLGSATFDAATGSHDLLCAAGGTGIAGIMSILQTASESGYLGARKALVCFGVRTSADLFFLERFAALKRAHPDTLRVIAAISDEAVAPTLSEAYPSIEFRRGMVHQALEEESTDEMHQPIAYAAGPPAAVEAIAAAMVTKHRIPVSSIRFDRFG
ncbi:MULTISPECIES: 2Fe-2S iron-sulfur cluster binding domain-containing protein [unclassified Variovorax]|uniref:2Fe-2S iron-sulfur cluster-binding protein n=1 Tax=unclassified Variovorax TaxID=663243 RepID=UPI0009FE1C87|nr:MULTISPECIES: 2Fe-2S iron-sulfur cluster binding domain-containing protein [unclassified Variovorax]PNG58832.1 putative methanesulfonate monooxygenase ferredoxin reductase subunit [Variovorax sp. B4]PNG61378.1 putative methanesulfonate monooxygenase ferredoxin reductase subunit [Variovorax sp. B2]VTV12620.1 Toluene-4-monooxygenase electron transfer component [Variovorax sp. WDL1]